MKALLHRWCAAVAQHFSRSRPRGIQPLDPREEAVLARLRQERLARRTKTEGARP